MKLYSKLARPVGILALGLVLVGGSFALAPRAYAVTDVFPCTIETEDGTIYPGTWINGVCQPNKPIPSSASVSAIVTAEPVGFFDRIKLWFTFNAEKKVRLLENFSNRNFASAKTELLAGNTAKAEILLKQSEKDNEKAHVSAAQIKDAEKKESVENSLAVSSVNRIQVLTAVRAKVENPVAKEAIQNAILRAGGDVKVDAGAKVSDNKSVSVSGSVSTNLGTVVSGNPIAKCLPTSAPSITVLSPNGNEIYTASQLVEVKWESCNIPTDAEIELELIKDYADGDDGITLVTTQNDGEQDVVFPSATSVFFKYALGERLYKIGAWAPLAYHAKEFSDNKFIVN